jgi:rod shape-determining protein MreC
MSMRPYYLAFSAVLLIALVALNLPGPYALRAKLVWGSTFMPLFGLAGSADDLANTAANALLPRSLLSRQLESLREDNQRLQLQLVQLQAAVIENQRLRQAVGFKPQAPWRLRLGRVIGHDPANWWRSALIDLGARDGILTNQPVLTGSGLVGRITEVAYTRSRVLLVGDPNCQLAAIIEQTRNKGIISPDEGSFDRQVVNLTYVPTTAVLEPGAMVVTSGDGGVFPKGIPIGRVIDVQTNEYGLYLEARVRLSANLNRLEEVWVLAP